MRYFNWTNIRLLLVLVLVAFLFSFSAKRNAQRKLRKSEVVFEDTENLLLTPEAVNKLLIENNSPASAIEKEKLDLNKLEKAVNAQEMVERSKVFVTVDGVLKAVVKQKTPIVRVFDETGSFYIDYEGNKMPLSQVYTARVPLVSGEINGADNSDLNEVFRFIHDDDFLSKNIIGIAVLSDGSLVMSNRNYKYDIDFGKPANIERKFNNYKAFYQKAALDSTINNYKIINLKFAQQVVCTK
jgi:cell division protein FtsQ